MRIFGNQFQKFCWRLKRETRQNRKPILLLFGNGYESQILLLALHRLKKKFIIVHVAEKNVPFKTRRILWQFKNQTHLILRPRIEDKSFKSFYCGNAICVEDLNVGFSGNDYFIISGFKLSEDSLSQAYYEGTFNSMYCPFLRYADEQIASLYQDMKDNDSLGSFLWKNITSDSHHNIEIL